MGYEELTKNSRGLSDWLSGGENEKLDEWYKDLRLQKVDLPGKFGYTLKQVELLLM